MKLGTLAGAVFAAACGTPDGMRIDELVRDGGLYFVPKTMEPFSGVAYATHDPAKDRVARMGLWREGYRGPFESYFRSRQVRAEETFVNGVLHGPYSWYFESGALFEEGVHVDGRREGPYRAYWETGDLYEEGVFVRGEFDGPRRWYKDGRLIEMVTYRLGGIDGLYERYLEDGTLDLKGMLHAGNPCGIWFEREHTIAYPACGIEATQ